ncbi:uncharacterized protein LOC120433258 [Oreochromis aureus]|uniref:uncharacterized protein LOC120433258 n=1 Tax=Oreochromis aureus TaxID=47969 RepID=UPI0019534D59|nr:uncharacterized protein LOC120433258 [Oreochromis aureus]
MAAFTWIQMSSLLILMLQFKGTTEQQQTVQTVTAGRGHDVTLPCENVIQGEELAPKPTTSTIKVTLKTTNIWTTKEEVKTSEGTLATINPDFLYLLRCIIVSVGLAALLISAVTVNMWIKCKGA